LIAISRSLACLLRRRFSTSSLLPLPSLLLATHSFRADLTRPFIQNEPITNKQARRKEKKSDSSLSAYAPFPSSSSSSPGGGGGNSNFSNSNPDTPPPASVFSEAARKALFRAADSCRKVGWGSFWTQLALSIASAGILLFSVAFTAQNGPAVSLYATLFGVVASFLSTFWTYGYTRLARRLRALAAAAARGGPLPSDMVRKGDVVATLRAGCYVNLAGLASTLLGLQATVGLLVAKTLTNATANPFLAGGAGSYSPVLALDVFLVQASTNTALAHFVSLVASLWLIKVVGAPVPAAPSGRA
jgi:hypothetical protein